MNRSFPAWLALLLLVPLFGCGSSSTAPGSADPFPGPCTGRFDFDNDGSPELVVTSAYDSMDRIVLSIRDSRGEGLEDQTWSYTYDAEGRLTSRAIDLDSDGTVDRIETVEYSGDAEVATLSEVGELGFLTRTTTVYDEEGRPVEQLEETPNSVTRSRYFHDDDGHLERVEVDEADDGSLERVTTYEVDAQGRRIGAETDLGPDGTVDVRVTFEYNADGNVTVIDTEVPPRPENGVRQVNTYDADGNVLRQEIDTGADGSVDRVNTYSYECFGGP